MIFNSKLLVKAEHPITHKDAPKMRQYLMSLGYNNPDKGISSIQEFTKPGVLIKVTNSGQWFAQYRDAPNQKGVGLQSLRNNTFIKQAALPQPDSGKPKPFLQQLKDRANEVGAFPAAQRAEEAQKVPRATDEQLKDRGIFLSSCKKH
jgi:hypothetical protein